MQRYTPPAKPARITASVVREAIAAYPVFNQLMALIAQELETKRESYEAQPASEYVRGQIVGIKHIQTLLTPQN